MNTEQLEKSIIKTVSSIFSLKNKDSESGEFHALRIKLASLIWKWASLTFNKAQLQNAGEEVMICINRSLKSYRGEAKKYINYISSALSKEIRRANQKLSIEEKNIIRLPDKKIRKIKDIIHYAEKCGKNINNFETQKWISNSFDYSMEEITKLLSWYSCSNVKSEYESFEDRTEVSIFDITDVCKKTGYKSTEELYLLKEENENIKGELHKTIAKIEAIFLEEKENTHNQLCSKHYLKALLTRQFLEELNKINCYECEEIIAFIEKTQFCDSLVCDAFIKEALPSQQEIAIRFGKDKTDASRKLKKFIKKFNNYKINMM